MYYPQRTRLSLQELHVEFGQVLDDTVEAKRRRRLQKRVLLARVAHVAEERLVQSRRMELNEPVIIPGQLKCMWRTGGDVQKITRPQ